MQKWQQISEWINEYLKSEIDGHLLQEERGEGHADNQKVQKVEGVSAEGTLMQESSIHSHLSNTPPHIFINIHIQKLNVHKHLIILHMTIPLSELKSEVLLQYIFMLLKFYRYCILN